jgi:hypothetical protein
MTDEPKSTTMEKHETATRSQPIVEQIDAWCAANGVSCYSLFAHAGLSRSSMTWWRQGKTPNRGALLCLEFAMKDLEKAAKKPKTVLVEH